MNTFLTHLRLACAALALGFAAPAQADPVVVELYTSQGCSSCPPADALLAELAENEDVIALALHVDYWDFIGWPDTFAQSAFGERQKDYARQAGARSVFTPHMVVGGTQHIAGARPMALVDQVRAQLEAPSWVRFSQASSLEGPVVMGMTEAAFDAPVDLILVTYVEKETVAIAHGENAGRTITYTHIVQDWRALQEWDGAETLTLRLPEGESDVHRVLLAQAKGPGAILGALRLD